MVITDLAVISFDRTGNAPPTLLEVAPGVSVEEVVAKTDFELQIPSGGPATMRYAGYD